MKTNKVLWVGGLAMFAIIVAVAVIIPLAKKGGHPSLTIYNLVIWSPKLVDTFESLCNEWGQLHNVDVTVVRVPLEDINAKLAAFVQSGTGADLAVFPAHKIPIFHEKLLDLTDCANEVAKPLGGYYEIAKQMTTVKGRFYGVPLYAWSHLWVYNGKLLREHNLQPANTYAEAEEIAKKLARPGEDFYPYGIGLGKDDDAAMFLQALLWAYGGKVVDSDGVSVAIRSEETKQAISYVVRLYKEDKVVPPGAFGWDGASNNKNFLAQKIAFTMNSPTILIQAEASNEESAQNIEHTIYPAGPKGRFSYATGFALGVLRDTPKKDLIVSFLRFFYARDNYRRLISSGNGAVNPWLLGCEDLDIWKDPRRAVGLQSLKIERHVGWPGPVTMAAAEVFDRRILAGIVNDVINNNMAIDDAISKADDEIRRIYDQYRGEPGN